MVQVGLNNLKSKFASIDGSIDIAGTFDNRLLKIIEIKRACAYSRIIVVPIPPTKVRSLNDKSISFNNMLFSCVNRFWYELGFNQFLDPNTGLFDNNYGRVFKVSTGRRDVIHLGRLGISKLSLMIKDDVMMPRYMTDNRSYSSIVGSCETISRSGVI